MSENHDEIALVKNLEALGITEKEAKIYLALLSRDYVGTSKVIAATGLHSQYVYDGLAVLEEKGLVHHVVQRGRKKFAAQSPKHLEVLVQEKQRTVDALIPQLLAISGKSDFQSFEVFQGVDSFKAEEFRKLESAAEGSRLDIIGDEHTLFYETMAEDMSLYENLRVHKKISLRYIASPKNIEKRLRSFPRDQYIEVRTLQGLEPGRVNTNIWDDRVSINIYGNPMLTFSLSNREIAANYRNFFDSLWNKCDPLAA